MGCRPWIFFLIYFCRKHRVSRAMQLSCSWFSMETVLLTKVYIWYCTLGRRGCEDTGSEDFFPLVIRAGQIGATQVGWLLFAATGLIRVVPPHLRGRAEHGSCGDVPTLAVFCLWTDWMPLEPQGACNYIYKPTWAPPRHCSPLLLLVLS